MEPACTQQHSGGPSGGGGGGGGEDDMQGMWQYLDSTLSTPNGAPPPASASSAPPPPAPPPMRPGGPPMMSAAMAEGDTPPLTEDDNGMYNELGDVFNMFFNLDTDDAQGGGGGPHGGGGGSLDPLAARVALSRHASAGSNSFGDGISPGLGAGYPSMSPATMLWLQSLGKSPSSESLSGLISPAGLFSGGGSAGGVSSAGGGGGDGGGGLPRSPSMEMIDWKAYNDAVGIAEKTQKEGAPKWRVIPQHGPHADGAAHSAPPRTAPPPSAPLGGEADAPSSGGLFTRQLHHIKSTVVSLVGALSTSDAANQQQQQQQQAMYPPPPLTEQQQQQQLTGVVLPTEVQAQYELAVQRMADEKNKRKAIISPEYVQYSSSQLNASAAPVPEPVVKNEVLESGQYATQVPDPKGRRPSKKSLHHASDDAASTTSSTLETVKEEAFPGGGPVRCKCTGKCRNARCACVKAGFVCGVHCKCVGCANPFVPMEKEGIDIKKMVDDVCLMQFLSKVKDMQELLDSVVTYECCGGGSVAVKHAVENGFECPKCHAHYTYSWCNNRLCHDQKKPRKHCAKCRRCGDHRNEHCDDCNHCYFAGVANSFSCSCKGGKNGSASGRSVVPNVGGSDASSPTGDRRNDEPMGPATASGSGSTNTMAAGLSSTEAEKDDECRMQ